EPDRGRRDRIERLTGLVQRSPRERDEKCVDGGVARNAAERDASQRRLGMGDRGRARENGGRGDRACKALQDAVAKQPGKGVEDATDRGAAERRDGRARYRVAAVG